MKTGKIAVFVVMVMVVLCAAARGEDADKPGRLKMAHRCGSGLADENTLRACEYAAYYGMDFVECDPRLTKDGVFVIMHDEAVDRTTDGSGKVADMTLEQIKKLKTANGESVPTLDELLDLASDLGIGVYMDTKFHDNETLQKMIDLVYSKGMGRDVVVGIWKQEQQEWIEKNHPVIRTCVSWPSPVSSLKKIKELGAEWVGLIVETGNRKNVDKVHRLGMLAKTTPVNGVAALKKKYDLGVDILQSDDPVLLDTIASVMEHSGNRTDKEKSLLPYEIKNERLPDGDLKSIRENLPEGSRLVLRLVYMTGYCAASNEPAGSGRTSVPPHEARLGDGSYANPVTIAVNPVGPAHQVGYGTMVYVPQVGWTEAADYCGACVRDADMNYRIDLWLGKEATAGDEERVTGWYWTYFEEKAAEK
ncbi:MAG TPA: glycerophosphodiester phosphodiesterase family protein [bacterium]|nr:glycerophosphodiester phosphodiesterase family protein [bacterium]